MEQNQQNSSGNFPNNSESFGSVQNDSESFRIIPNHSETFGTVPKASEPFRSVPISSERKENHTLTVRDAARMFEAAGVARTERSIVNWCQPNRMGIPRLDSYFDPNERKYYLTPESVGRAIQEEIQKATKVNEPSEPFGTVPKASETPKAPSESSGMDDRVIRDMEREIADLKIANRVKDGFIEHLQKEKTDILDLLVESSRKTGELETRLLQLNGPQVDSTRPVA